MWRFESYVSAWTGGRVLHCMRSVLSAKAFRHEEPGGRLARGAHESAPDSVALSVLNPRLISLSKPRHANKNMITLHSAFARVSGFACPLMWCRDTRIDAVSCTRLDVCMFVYLRIRTVSPDRRAADIVKDWQGSRVCTRCRVFYYDQERSIHAEDIVNSLGFGLG